MKTFHAVLTESEQYAIVNALVFYYQFFVPENGVAIEEFREAFREDGAKAVDRLADKIARLE